jgi:hypothetical protein
MRPGQPPAHESGYHRQPCGAQPYLSRYMPEVTLEEIEFVGLLAGTGLTGPQIDFPYSGESFSAACLTSRIATP